MSANEHTLIRIPDTLPTSQRSRRPLSPTQWSLISIGSITLLWWAITASGLVPALFLPPPAMCWPNSAPWSAAVIWTPRCNNTCGPACNASC